MAIRCISCELLLYSRRVWGYCSWSSPIDQAVRKFEDGSGINVAMIFFFFRTRTAVQASCEKHSMKWCLRRVESAATVTTDAKPHTQQQLARDLEVERAAMGQRCRSQSFGEVQRCNPPYFL